MMRLLKLTVALGLVVALLIPAGMALSAVLADVDIKPMSCPNPLNVNSKGVLPVAILGGELWDVTVVDPATVELEGVAPLRWALEDVAGPGCSGPDGYLDLTLQFKTQEIADELGAVNDGDVVLLYLTGNLIGGAPFGGYDEVWIIKKT